MDKVFIIKGGPIAQEQINEIEAWPQSALGSPEWQFSDAPSGERGSSADYADLLLGLQDHKGRSFNIDEADFTDDERKTFEAFVALGDAK